MLIDTHAHLNFPDYQEDLDLVIKNALTAKVNKIICVSSNVADSQKAVEIARKYPGVVYAAVGIHPQQTDPENPEPLDKQVEKLTELAKSKEVVAVGECGLDYSPAPPNEKDRSVNDQATLFKSQIGLAKNLGLPLIIHTRKAFDNTVSILSEYQNLRGVFHCYYNGKNGINKVEELGFLFGIDGNLTYDTGLQNVASFIPLEKIILETDSPFLAPEPLRGSRNEPENVRITASKLAEIKNVDVDKIEEITTKNAQKLFNF